MCNKNVGAARLLSVCSRGVVGSAWFSCQAALNVYHSGEQQQREQWAQSFGECQNRLKASLFSSTPIFYLFSFSRFLPRYICMYTESLGEGEILANEAWPCLSCRVGVVRTLPDTAGWEGHWWTSGIVGFDRWPLDVISPVGVRHDWVFRGHTNCSLMSAWNVTDTS